MSLFEVLIRGGWLMVPIALSSLVVIALGVGRWLIIRRANQELEGFLREWGEAPAATERLRFVKACEHGPEAVAQMAAALRAESAAEPERREALEGAARGELFALENGLGTIATLAAATPLLGFLGTVTGMIRAFMQIQNLGGNVNANVLAGGIWEALVTTAAGLAVGITALIIHNYLSGMVRLAARQLERCSEAVSRVLGGGDET